MCATIPRSAWPSQATTSAGIEVDSVLAIVTIVSLLQEVFQDVLSAVFPSQPARVLCLAYIVNLASEVFHHFGDLRIPLEICYDEVLSIEEARS